MMISVPDAQLLREGERNSHLQSKYHMPGTRPDFTPAMFLNSHKPQRCYHCPILQMKKCKTQRFKKIRTKNTKTKTIAGKWKGRLNPSLSLS